MDVWTRIDQVLEVGATQLQYRALCIPGYVGEGRVIVEVGWRRRGEELRYINLETGLEKEVSATSASIITTSPQLYSTIHTNKRNETVIMQLTKTLLFTILGLG